MKYYTYTLEYDDFFDYIKNLSKIDNPLKYLIDNEYIQEDRVCFILQILCLSNIEEINRLRQIPYTPKIFTEQYEAFKNRDPFLNRYIKQQDINNYFNFA